MLLAAVDLCVADRGDGAQSGFSGACETRRTFVELGGEVGLSPRGSGLPEQAMGRRRGLLPRGRGKRL